MQNTENSILLIIIFILAILFFTIGTRVELGVAWGIAYISVVLLSYRLSQRGYIMGFAVLCSAFTILGYFLAPRGGEFWKVITNRVLSLYAIWVTAILLFHRKKREDERERVIRELEEARTKIKILSGFLPTCSSCKKIKDESGDWKQMEAYISEHSEAEFSHGLCPACAMKLYPDQYKKLYEKDNK